MENLAHPARRLAEFQRRHAGCAVEYDQSAALIVCPCHGSQFNAATGAVEVGPAATGLKPITIAKGSNGQLYVT